MRYFYKDLNGQVYEYQSQEEREIFGYPDLTAMTAAQVEAHLNPPKTEEELAAEARAVWKAEREIAVSLIKVTTEAGNMFDGDEISQGRMARAVVSMTSEDTITWVLADNTVVQATQAELQEALKLAGAAQASIWVPVVEEPVVEEPVVEDPVYGT
jgi:hypothetical protein